MPELLFEVFSEEIPARMQRQAAADLQRLVTAALVEAGVSYEGARALATPRRLCLSIHGLPQRQPDLREEKKGPRVGAPEAAVQGFLKAAGLASLAAAKIESDPKKGDFYVAVIEKQGRATIDLLAEILPATIRALPWPKSMRWGPRSANPGALRWVRPLRAIVATFGAEGEEPEVVPFEIEGITAGKITYGHRFLAPAPFHVRRFEDYSAGLEAAKVVLDAERRKQIIRADAGTQAFAQGLEVVEDEGLLEEVAGLVEWPVVLMGSFDPAFLDVPGEVVRATIRANQKCFVLKKPDGTLANRFLLTANIEAADGGKTIIAGNERVIGARLADAKFFWDSDRKTYANDPEFTRLEKFRHVTFHDKLGSQWDRIERIRALAGRLCAATGADAAQVDLAARICKADLLTEVVGEFPELQGLMGRKYATLLGLPDAVAAACEEHYKPVGPTDFVPRGEVSLTIALADKLDTLAGFWVIDEKPTGSKDPYALRRAALGVIRLIVENGLRLNLTAWFHAASAKLFEQRPALKAIEVEAMDEAAFSRDLLAFFHERLKVMLREKGVRHDLLDAVLGDVNKAKSSEVRSGSREDFASTQSADKAKSSEVRSGSCEDFASTQSAGKVKSSEVRSGSREDFASTQSAGKAKSSEVRSGSCEDFVSTQSAGKVKSSEVRSGSREDFASNDAGHDDLVLILRRVEALGEFLATEGGKSLLAGYKRAANILRAEEKKDGEGAFEHSANAEVLVEPAEKALHAVLKDVGTEAAAALARQDHTTAMAAMARLHTPVAAFFEAVLVNAPAPALRLARLGMLAGLRRVTRQVADLSKIAG